MEDLLGKMSQMVFFFLCVGVAGDEKAKNDRGCFLGSTVLMV
jgi:hypothetical protein